jgi:hypothetical protein
MKIMFLKSGCSCRFYLLIIIERVHTQYILKYVMKILVMTKRVTISFKYHFIFL